MAAAVWWGNLDIWRAVEARLNAHPQFLTPIDGVQIHFFHIRAKSGRGRPLLLLHGWPGSQIEFLDLIDALCAPGDRSEEHTSELQSLMRISSAVFCLKNKSPYNTLHNYTSMI